jgi:hypothetical protein
VRAQDSAGDYTFGQSQSNFLIDSPAAVGQLVETRLLLLAGEWFLNTGEGTPYGSQILGPRTASLYDQAIRQRVLQTTGIVNGVNTALVTSIVAYASVLDPATRKLSVQMTIDTTFGQTKVQAVI